MAKVKSKELFWDESPSPDAVGTRIYYEIGEDATVNYNSPSQFFPKGTSAATLDLILDGVDDDVVSFAGASVDDAGNEGDLYQAEGWVNVPFDVTPPEAISGGGIRDLQT